MITITKKEEVVLNDMPDKHINVKNPSKLNCDFNLDGFFVDKYLNFGYNKTKI